MATARPSTVDVDATAASDRPRAVELLESYRDHPLTTPVRAAAFWAAVVLPAVYLSLLAVGPDVAGGRTAFFGLLGLHALSVVAGHGYGHE